MSEQPKLGIAGRFARVWIDSKLTPLVIAGSLALGAFAVWKLPREEEPQIKVPSINTAAAIPNMSRAPATRRRACAASAGRHRRGLGHDCDAIVKEKRPQRGGTC